VDNALYNDQLVMRFSAISDQINNVDKKIEDLRLDIQSAIHNEFSFLIQKMLLPKRETDNSLSAAASIDYGGRS
jgi:hypothetical protein